MKKTTKHLWKSFIFVILNLAFLFVLLWSLMIYTSLFKNMPWYEPCGMQFLVIFLISDPAFLIIGVALLILGRFYRISRSNRWFPFIAIAALSVPILIDGSLSPITLLIGTSLGTVLCFLIIISTIRNLIIKR